MLEVPKRVDVLMINFESTGGSYVNLDSDAFGQTIVVGLWIMTHGSLSAANTLR
jgi:hypothetical protein